MTKLGVNLKHALSLQFADCLLLCPHIALHCNSLTSYVMPEIVISRAQ